MLISRMASRPADRRCWKVVLLACIGLAWIGLTTSAGAAAAAAGTPPVDTAPVLMQPRFGPPKPLTPDVIAKTCQVEHDRFCRIERAGTRSDVSCLQQHHIGLRLTCRKLLARTRTTAVPTTGMRP